jgi:methyl coenzyme M reductase gamma subunit
MREQLIRALLAHAQGEIEMHKANVEVYLTNPVGIGEHPEERKIVNGTLSGLTKKDGLLNKHLTML